MTMSLRMPPGACNAHCHVFGPRERFAYADDAPFVPLRDAPRDELYALNDRLGLQRCVVVQSTCHGFDNAVTEHAIAGRPHDYRGIALLRADTPDAELRRLDAAGFRGVRFNYGGHLGRGAAVDDVRALAARIASLGWHLQLHGEPRLVLHEIVPALLATRVTIVIDHVGRVDASQGEGGRDFRALRALLADARVWVKLSGVDRISRAGPPYADALPLARLLCDEFAERVLWGNDWPHPNHDAPPDDDVLARLIDAIAPSAPARRRLLVDNPLRLYRFGDDAGAAR